MTAEETTYTLLEGRGLLLNHGDEELRLAPDEPLSRPAATSAAPAGAKLELAA
jgi:hypothetical protein